MDLVQFGQIRFDDAVVWTDLTQVTRWDLFDDLNVKYLLSSRPLSLPQDRFELLATFKHEPVFVFYRGMRETDVLVYRNRQARPRAYFAGPILAVPDLASAQAALSQRSVRSVTIVENPDGARPSTAVSAEDRLLVLGAADGSLDLSYHSGGERFLVVSEIWHPGWRATLDGRPISLYPTNLSLLGTWLPGGEHRVSLVFRPSHFAAGSAVSLCALLVLLCALLWVLNRKGASKEAWKPGSDGMAVGRR
jgi:hypothetical protein